MAADFDFWGIPPPRNFAKIHARGGRGLQWTQPRDPIPPTGAQPSAAAAVPESAARPKNGGVPRRGGRGRPFGLPADGRCAGAKRRAFPARKARRFSPGNGARTARRRACPREAHKGRVSGVAARGGHVLRGGGARAYTAAFRARRGEGAAYTAGGPGIAGATCLLPGRGGRRRGAGAKRCHLRGLCRVIRHMWGWWQRRGRKAAFSLYKEALLSGGGLCRLRADFARKPCRFRRVAFSATRSDECVTPSGAAKAPPKKRNATEAKGAFP